MTKQSAGSSQSHVTKHEDQRNFSKSEKSNSYTQFQLKTDFIAAEFITHSLPVYLKGEEKKKEQKPNSKFIVAPL